MRLINEELAADLLGMGERRLLLCGFRGANLRSIVASMEVTTGAIYHYRAGKVELFGTLVEESTAELLERYREIQKSFSQLPLEQ